MAVNVVTAPPAPIVTLAGTVRVATLLESETTAPPLAAAFVSVTVQVEVPVEPRLPGLHEIPLTRTGATSERFAVCELPFRDAVTVTVWSLLTVPTVAVKVAVEDPDVTVTLPGTVRVAALLESDTAVPPGAAFDSVTVQVAAAEGARLVGLQERPVS